MAALGQTITVVNKSGKVVSTSKHLVNAFKEAKAAYQERKAELRATRNDEVITAASSARNSKRTSRRPSPESRNSSRAGSAKGNRKPAKSSGVKTGRKPLERGYSDSFIANDDVEPTVRYQTSPLRRAQTAGVESQDRELVRRRSLPDTKSISSSRRAERDNDDGDDGSIDMALAYGDGYLSDELPPALPERRLDDEQQLRVKMSVLTRMLEEANCVEHSARAIISHLEENPEAMAAVAMTLAEISNMASKIAPGALMTLKGSFPAVIALLISPEFLIAVGVGVGITVVALGGYKIIKKMRAKRVDGTVTPTGELEDVSSDIGRIEHWRRGIAPSESTSVATSVEGELMTPMAGRRLREEGVIESKEQKKERKKEKERKEKHSKDEKEKGKKEKHSKDVGKKVPSSSTREQNADKSSRDARHAKEKNQDAVSVTTIDGGKGDAAGERKSLKKEDAAALMKLIFSKRDSKKDQQKMDQQLLV